MIRYKKLGYIAFDVTDLEESARFYTEIVGLTLTSLDPGHMATFSCDGSHHCIALYQASAAGLRRIAYELEDDAQLANVRRALAGAKVASREVAPTELSSLRIGTALRFGDDNGVEIEMYGGMQARPDGPLENPAGLRRLSHVVLFVPNLKKTLAFYESVLNFKVSDVRHKDDGHVYFAYLRCFPNPYHHSFAIVETPELRYFHTAFSIDSLDALMRRRNYLVRKQVVVAPTPGRHKASGSIFQYFSDPDGLTLEYTLGMEEFPEVGARGPRSLDAKPSTSDMWEGMRADNLPNVGTIVRIDG